MSNYSSHFSTLQTPQSEPIPDKKQVVNAAGGYVFEVDDWTRLDRFLVLGCEANTYYQSAKELTIENAQCILRCCALDGPRTVARIVEISEAGRAPKNDPAIFALAICAGYGHDGIAPNVAIKAGGQSVDYAKNTETRRAALEAMPRVCRIGTHLFSFLESVEKFRGHGRALNRALQQWYVEKEPTQAAFQAMKYQQRNGWSHRDVLRLCKPKTADQDMNAVFHWITKGWSTVGEEVHDRAALQGIWAFERAKKATDKTEVCKLIRDFNLPRECVPTQFLTEASVWEALLEKMPMTAMVRNLATMTRVGLLAPMSAGVAKVMGELTNVERIRKSRLHPIAILSALLTYKQGRGEKGQHSWSPVAQIVDALDGAFYTAFGNIEPTNKRWLLALDVSGSMTSGTITGVPNLTPRVGSAAMALVTAATEPQHAFMAFSDTFMPLAISPRQRLDDVCATISGLPFAGTDCALPMLYALQRNIPVDVFCVVTDNETWRGSIHPCQALKQYRQKMGIASKLIVVGMTATGTTIGDVDDAGTLDVVGFDTAAPTLMADFARG
jgi:60 kDa SS-A/Ro ribonucleoprotein